MEYDVALAGMPTRVRRGILAEMRGSFRASGFVSRESVAFGWIVPGTLFIASGESFLECFHRASHAFEVLIQ